MKIKGRIISKGRAEGEALVTNQAISFYGSVDFKTGEIIEKNHELFGKSIKGKVLVFPSGKGSTVGSYALYRLKKSELAPSAIINTETEPIIATGAIISGIPLIDRLERKVKIKTGDFVIVDCLEGYIEKK